MAEYDLVTGFPAHVPMGLSLPPRYRQTLIIVRKPWDEEVEITLKDKDNDTKAPER